MRKVRVAFYGFSDEHKGFIDAAKSLAKHFLVQCFENAETDTFLEYRFGEEGAVIRIQQFNPHILVIRYPGNGLDLYALLKERIYFLPVLLTVFAEDSSSLEVFKKAGIVPWQVADMNLTYESFAKHVLLRFKREHLDK